MMTQTQADETMGKVSLFLGTYVRGWSVAQFVAAAQDARAMGVDTIICKVFDGGISWFSPAQISAIRKAVLGVGCGFMPFGYCYGPKYGTAQIGFETNLLKAAMDASDGFACADMEVEWNNQPGAAATFASQMRGHGSLWLSTWADPVQQAWDGVIAALDPVVVAWMPQQYNNFLDSVESQLSVMKPGVIQPTFDLSQEFGANDVLGHVKTAVARGHHAISLWEKTFADQNRSLVSSIAAAMGKAPAPNPTPTPPPPPAPGGLYTYTIQSGDTLSAIAARLGLNWLRDLYQPNQAVIEAAARAHGRANSDNGNYIYPGTVLKYTK